MKTICVFSVISPMDSSNFPKAIFVSGRNLKFVSFDSLHRSKFDQYLQEMEEEDNYKEYVPVAKRRAMEVAKILQRKGKPSPFEDEVEKSKLAEAKPSFLVKASQLKRD
ncbi:hypothetical protein RHMOL_Rhmol07G0298000 [Rhododendron molle]|uniref:Uncharacterized protein n=1 Tax=Rhododendron molle TaxID=49168 RepID=A0ACC0N649_RHOML|nr:hypothetical protein RHMOL_Rhmol07G0298000 [Rhododendron molle]